MIKKIFKNTDTNTGPKSTINDVNNALDNNLGINIQKSAELPIGNNPEPNSGFPNILLPDIEVNKDSGVADDVVDAVAIAGMLPRLLDWCLHLCCECDC